MDKNQVISAVKAMRDASRPRKFTQSVEISINFRGIDFKRAENRIDTRVSFPHVTGKGSAKVALFAQDKNFISMTKNKVARVIVADEIPGIDKKAAAKLAEEFDAFLAEGPTMLLVGKHLGQVLAPKGKMPRPVQPEPAALDAALKTLTSSVRVTNKKGKFMPVVHVLVGKESMSDEQIADNIMAAYNAVLSQVSGEQDIKNVYVKLTMGKPIRIGEVAA